MSMARTCHQHQQNGLQSEKDIAWCLLQCRFIIFSYHSVSNKSSRVLQQRENTDFLANRLWSIGSSTFMKLLSSDPKVGDLTKYFFRCKIILIFMQTIDNLGKRVWKADQKEMKRTANAEKNLQRFLFCRQGFSAKKVEPQCFSEDFPSQWSEVWVIAVQK